MLDTSATKERRKAPGDNWLSELKSKCVDRESNSDLEQFPRAEPIATYVGSSNSTAKLSTLVVVKTEFIKNINPK